MKALLLARWTLLNLLAVAGCAAMGLACLRLQPAGAPLPALWLTPALGVFLMTIGDRRLLPGVWLGQAAALMSAGMAWYTAGLVGGGEAAAAWLGAVLLRRLLAEGLTRDDAPVRFLLIAYGAAALAALYAPLVLRAFGSPAAARIDTAIIDWWLGDALGIVVLVPALLAAREAVSRRRDPVCGVGMAVLAVGTAAFGILTFGGRDWLANPALQAALLLPPLMLLAVRCQPVLAYGLNLVLAAALAYGAGGSFGLALGATPAERVFALHGFVLVASLCVLFLSAHAQGGLRAAASALAGEERFRRLSALTSDWYWEQDAEYRFTRLEGAAIGDAAELQWNFVGKRHEELPGFEPYDTSWEAHVADLEARRTFQGRILRYTRPDGRVSYYSTCGEPMYEADGSFSGYRGVGRDVTLEIDAREALLASERQFHDVADATFEGLLVHDYGRIVFANRSCAEMAGRSIEDLVGRLLLDFVAPEEHARIIRHLAGSDSVKSYETICVASDGRHFPVEIFARPFVFQGKPMRIVAIRDIGERRRTEAAMRAQIAFQRTLLDTIPNPVIYKDRQGRYLGYNKAFADFVGIRPDEYIGRTVLDILPGDLGRRIAARDEALFASPGIQSYEEATETPRGRRDVVIYKDVFHDEKGDVAGSVGIFVDITERKKIELRLRRFQELSPAAIGIVSTAGQVIYMNPAAGELFGYRIEDVPNMEAWWQLAYPDPAYRADRYAAWIAAVELTLREGRYMFRFEGRVRCMDGRDRWIETMVSLGEDEIFMIFTDLTDYVEGPATA